MIARHHHLIIGLAVTTFALVMARRSTATLVGTALLTVLFAIGLGGYFVFRDGSASGQTRGSALADRRKSNL